VGWLSLVFLSAAASREEFSFWREGVGACAVALDSCEEREEEEAVDNVSFEASLQIYKSLVYDVS
jgi:hypothetical protein